MKNTTRIITSVISGIALSHIPWGDPKGFHGAGMPIPSVIWDKGVDYPNFYAFLYNIAIVYTLLFIIGKVYSLTKADISKSSDHAKTQPDKNLHQWKR